MLTGYRGINLRYTYIVAYAINLTETPTILQNKNAQSMYLFYLYLRNNIMNIIACKKETHLRA